MMAVPDRIEVAVRPARWRFVLQQLCTSRLGLRMIYPILRAFCIRSRTPAFLHHLYPWLTRRADTVARALPPQGRHIVVLRPDHIGDFLYSLPAILRLRDSLQVGDRMTLVLDPCNATLAARLAIDCRVVLFQIFDETGRKLLPSRDEFVRLQAALGPVDVAIDMRPDGHSGIILARIAPSRTYRISNRGEETAAVLGSEGTSRLRPGPDNPEEVWFFSRSLQGARSQLMFDFADAVTRHLFGVEARLFERGLAKATELLATRFPAAQQGTVVFCPEARNPQKVWSWPIQQALVRGLLERGLELRVIGQRKARCFPGLPSTSDLRGKTSLDEALSAIAEARAFIGFDTGPAHFAALYGVPTFTIFNGRTDPAVWSGVAPAGRAWIIEHSGAKPGPAERAALAALFGLLEREGFLPASEINRITDGMG